MKIGFDIDGVLNDFEKFLEFVREKYSLKVSDECGSNFDTRFGISLDRANEIWDAERYSFASNFPARKEVVPVLSELIKNNEIIIITNRGFTISKNITLEKMKEFTINWLKTNHIPYSKLYFVKEKEV